jgi:hypothetical protein
VSVVKCRDLPAKDPNLGSSDPYVKLQLLPDKQHKVKTRVLRKTCNPVYDEDFTFYGINFNQLQACIYSIEDCTEYWGWRVIRGQEVLTLIQKLGKNYAFHDIFPQEKLWLSTPL